VTASRDLSRLVTFRPLSDDAGLEVRDEAADSSYVVRTDGAVTPEAASTDQFPFPVDEAVAFTASTLRIPDAVSLLLRDESGDYVGHFYDGPRYVPRGTHYVEADFTSKTYFRFEHDGFTGTHPASLDNSGDAVFRFGDRVRVVVGVRSAHTKPSGTIETPADPAAMMTAISHLGSSIKEFSPERSWPRLRGHPPRIEVGDELTVPDHLERPETGIEVTIPPTYEAVYATAPLAYYLGATVTPGDRSALRTPSGLSYRLATDAEPLADATERLLVQCFFLDTLTRVGGYYDFDRIDYEKVAPYLPFYPPDLYDEPVWRQVEEYLEVDFSDVAPHVPRWPVRATLRPVADDVSAIPYLLDDLALVRAAPDASATRSTREWRIRRAGHDAVDRYPCESLHREAPRAPTDAERRPVDTDYDAYTTAEVPVTGGVLVPEAYRRRPDRPRWPVDETPVTVVCNDPDRRSEVERAVESLRDREPLPALDVTLVDGATTAELRTTLESTAGVVHYVGSVTAAGFACADGRLDPASVETCEPTVVLVSGAETPAAGVELVERGADAALVTLGGAPNAEAVAAPARVVELLNAGYPVALGTTLVFASHTAVEYVLAGDGGLELTHRDPSNALSTHTVDSRSPDCHDLTISTMIGAGHKVGASGPLKDNRDRDNVVLSSTCVDLPVPFDTDEIVGTVGPYTAVRLNHRPVRLGAELTPELVEHSVE
jgi:hypothetical protein